uniref:Uncharacterized protein n=1 Tax=uncultured marine virus TaxID=186617 RepID=A0A0F7L7Q8_9VIRU|nr:hypothetical protein [uncultured marine virus]
MAVGRTRPARPPGWRGSGRCRPDESGCPGSRGGTWSSSWVASLRGADCGCSSPTGGHHSSGSTSRPSW